MKSREIRWIMAATAAGLLAGAAIGQTERQEPEAPATESKAPQARQQATDQADAAKGPTAGRGQPREVEESAPGKSVRKKGQTGRISDADRQAWRKALVAEATYRKRLAMVRRYRELAEQAGDKKRVVKANFLEGKIDQAHTKAMERAREQLGDAKFNLIKARIEQGRERRGKHGKSAAAGKGRGPGGKPGADHKEGQQGSATGTGTGTGRGATGTEAPSTEKQDPQKRSRQRGETDTGRKKSEDS